MTPVIGRPKDQEKRAAMIDAATALFFGQGFASTTLEAVAAAAGVSKVTLYGHFGDKGGLFVACIEAMAGRMEAAMQADAGAGRPLAQSLVTFGIVLMSHIMTPSMLEFERHLVGDVAQHPELATRLFEAGPGRMHRRLMRLLEEGAARGEIALDDPRLAADDLFGLWHGFTAAETKFGVAVPPTPAEIDARVRRGVERFLRAYRT